jgi:hypothetical protein
MGVRMVWTSGTSAPGQEVRGEAEPLHRLRRAAGPGRPEGHPAGQADAQDPEGAAPGAASARLCARPCPGGLGALLLRAASRPLAPRKRATFGTRGASARQRLAQLNWDCALFCQRGGCDKFRSCPSPGSAAVETACSGKICASTRKTSNTADNAEHDGKKHAGSSDRKVEVEERKRTATDTAIRATETLLADVLRTLVCRSSSRERARVVVTTCTCTGASAPTRRNLHVCRHEFS